MSYNVSNISELFQTLESNNQDVVKEIKQVIYEMYDEVKESWLVYGLYDAYCQSGSARCLQVLLDVRDPHERFLLDKITEGLKQQDKARLNSLIVLGYVIRKQPSWLYKLTQHVLLKELLKILKTEEDIVMMMNALLDLLALMPIVPAYIAKYLPEIFEVFSRFASWRYQCVKDLPDIQKVHLQVGLFAFFHRLYGMFPCNFLSYLRTQYSDNNKEHQAVFIHTIRPMLTTVTMHPLLVTHSRDLEKSDIRWKKMELHDVIVESSRYSLVSQESAKEDDISSPLDIDVGSVASTLKSSAATTAEINAAAALPSSSGTMVAPVTSIVSGNADTESSLTPTTLATARQSQDSPPEAAIEATPETTPFVTPIKDEKFKFARPAPSSQVSRHLRLDVGNLRSPQPYTSNGSSASLSKTSPTKEVSPFRFPDVPNRFDRRDSLFSEKIPNSEAAAIAAAAALFIQPKTPVTSAPMASSSTLSIRNDAPRDVGASAIALSSTALLASIAQDDPVKKMIQSEPQQRRPSPIKFTSQRPKQFPIQPKPERVPAAVADAVKHKMLSLDNLRDSLPDFGREEDDDEVTEITGGSDNRPNDLSTRHITPMIDSASTSRTVSRLSTSSQADDARKSDCSLPSRPTTSTGVVSRLSAIDISADKVASVTSPAASSDCKGGGLHPPSRDTVSDFVKQIRGRIRYASLCAPGNSTLLLGSSGITSDIDAEVASALSSIRTLDVSPESPGSAQTLRRSSSCPDAIQILHLLKKKAKLDELSETTVVDDLRTCSASLARGDNNGGGGQSSRVDFKRHQTTTIDSSIQTEAFLIYPYEHLFPAVLPNWFDCQHGKGESEDASTSCDPNPTNPYTILDQLVSATSSVAIQETAENKGALKSVDSENKFLKDEIALLQSQLLFERYRREILGVRNRRLLGKTKSSRILEERNTALEDQLQMIQSEVNALCNELESLRRQKHNLEEERAKNDQQRDKEIELLMSENKGLKQQLLDMESKCEKQEGHIRSEKDEISRIEAALFNAKSEIDRLRKKEEYRLLCEREMVNLRKEVLLLGELLRKHRENDVTTEPSTTTSEFDLIYIASAKQQLAVCQAELNQKSTEVDAFKARVLELEQVVAKKDQAMTDQKRLLKKVKEEHEEDLQIRDLSYNTLMKVQSQLEGRILELQDQLSKAMRQGQNRRPRASSSPSTTPRSSSGAVPAAARASTSASMNIEQAHSAMTFTVGSPPSSSGGSCGSDRSELIRRGLESGFAGVAGSRSPPDPEPRSVNGNGGR